MLKQQLLGLQRVNHLWGLSNFVGFLLSSPYPTERTRKKWISQGNMAKWGVVIANLIIKDKQKGSFLEIDTNDNKGPHAFIVDMESPGVLVEDMPRKTTFNSLDTSYVTFNNVMLPLDAMLSGLCYITPDGTYELVDDEVLLTYLVLTCASNRLISCE